MLTGGVERNRPLSWIPMDRNRWKTVNEIFHAALEIPASERREFVCTASWGDPELQAEVDRLKNLKS